MSFGLHAIVEGFELIFGNKPKIEFSWFFLNVIVFNVPIIFIMSSHHFTLRQSFGKTSEAPNENDSMTETDSAINKATNIEKK